MLIPDDKLKSSLNFNLAPMIDFLFLLLAFFATLAVTRTSIFDRSLNLVHLQHQPQDSLISSDQTQEQIHLSITKEGFYKWMTDVHDYIMPSERHIQNELVHQYNQGILSGPKEQTQILLHIDREAPWENVANLIYSIRQVGFSAHPIYQPVNDGEFIVENHAIK